MKYFLLVSIVFLITTACEKGAESSCLTPVPTASCIDTSLIDPTAMCTEEYDPVCGCDGLTYSNGCHATINGVTSFVDGPCCE